MATSLVYTVGDYLPFTKIASADANQDKADVRNRLNWAGGTDATTGLGDDNIQSNTATGGGLTRSTKLKAGTANYAVFNDADGKMTEAAQLPATAGGLGFIPTFTGNAGKAIIVNPAEDSFELGSPSQSTITEQPASDVSDITAGEAITIRDAVCLDISRNGSNADTYKVFKTDSDFANRRRNWIGFAKASASVTPQVQTWTDSAALVTGNVITWSINGRAYSQSFVSDNDATLSAIATQIGGDSEVQGAVVTDAGSNDRVITITGKGGLTINISGALVTGGASQATVTLLTTQAPVGGAVQIHSFGPMSGFSGLVTGNIYYLSDTAGAITDAPTDTDPIKVGQAWSSSVLFVNPNFATYQFSTPSVWVVGHGATGSSNASATATSYHFNFVTWSLGATDTQAFRSGALGQCVLGTYHYAINGVNTSGTYSLFNRQYNKVTWATGTNRSAAVSGFGVSALSNILYSCKGYTGAAYTKTADSFNGTSWTNGIANFVDDGACLGVFTHSSIIHAAGGNNNGTLNNRHETFNGVTVGSSTNVPVSETWGGGASVGSSTSGWLGNPSADGTASYAWSGSWSSSITCTYGANVDASGNNMNGVNAGIGFNDASNLAYLNGGRATGGTVATSAVFNGVTWSAGVSSTIAKNGLQGGVF